MVPHPFFEWVVSGACDASAQIWIRSYCESSCTRICRSDRDPECDSHPRTHSEKRPTQEEETTTTCSSRKSPNQKSLIIRKQLTHSFFYKPHEKQTLTWSVHYYTKQKEGKSGSHADWIWGYKSSGTTGNEQCSRWSGCSDVMWTETIRADNKRLDFTLSLQT